METGTVQIYCPQCGKPLVYKTDVSADDRVIVLTPPVRNCNPLHLCPLTDDDWGMLAEHARRKLMIAVRLVVAHSQWV